ncbi:MAG: acyltransferase [Solirubrobacterales bacterium]|nr:acyltransferase [Solirubrobacterales bacterium]
MLRAKLSSPRPVPALQTGGLPRLPLMDAIRALAALSIVVYHGASGVGRRPDGLLGQLTGSLHVGVIVFFVISGTLLYRPFVARRLAGRPAPALCPYLTSRFLRIVPGYWVALLIAVPVLGLTDVLTPSGLVKYFGFLQIYDPGGSQGLSQAWSLCVELSFYLTLPALALAIAGTLRGQLAALGVIALAGLAWPVLAVRGFAGDGLTTALFSLPNFLDEFAFGMALATVSAGLAAGGHPPRWVGWVERHAGACWALAGLCYVGIILISGPRGAALGVELRLVAGNLLPDIMATLIILPAVFGAPGHGRVRRLLAAPALVRLGVISYGLYLYHPIAYRTFVEQSTGRYVLFSVPLTIVLATASWWLVERPALRLKLRFASGPVAAEPPPPVLSASRLT